MGNEHGLIIGIMNKVKRKTIKILYRLLFNYLDKDKIYLFSNLDKLQNKTRYQNLFGKMHYHSLLGLNYLNNDPKTNGEYYIISTLAGKFSDKQNVTIFDCGSNVGEYTLEIFKQIKNSTIHCFEPSLDTYNKLIRNTEHLTNIIYNNIGIGEATKEVMLYKSSEISALASVYKRNLEHINVTLNLTEKIKITTLDKYCLTYKIENIDFLKLDVEGNEYNAFLGANRLISEKRIKYIQFEMGGCNIDSKVFWKEIYQLLNPYYKLYRIISDGLVEFIKYEEFHEIFVYSNYFAELRE